MFSKLFFQVSTVSNIPPDCKSSIINRTQHCIMIGETINSILTIIVTTTVVDYLYHFISSGFIRLANGTQTTTTYSGRIEVFINGEWGTVCSDGWYYSSARVVCRELGYPILRNYHILPSHYNSFEEGKEKIWLSKVQCNSRKHSIFECQQSGFGDNDCSHSQDLGITCSTSQYGTP